VSEDEQAQVIAATVKRLNEARSELRCWRAKADLAARHWDYTARMLRAAADDDRWVRPGRLGDNLHPETEVAEIFDGISRTTREVAELEARVKEF